MRGTWSVLKKSKHCYISVPYLKIRRKNRYGLKVSFPQFIALSYSDKERIINTSEKER